MRNRNLDPDIGIKITLPDDEEHMIVGVWWQHEFVGMNEAHIRNVRKFEWLASGTSSTWMYQNLNNVHDDLKWDEAEEGKEKRRKIIYLERPIYTKQVKLKEIKFYAKPWNSWFPKGTSDNTFIPQGDYIPFNLGHDIYVQIELYGCPKYDMNKSELMNCYII